MKTKNKYLFLALLSWVLALFCWLLMGCGHSRAWTKTERVMLGASWLAAGADFYTTEKALDNPNNHECNPLMGKHPSDTELVMVMLTGQVGVTVLAHIFPKWRKWLLGGKTAVNTGCAVHNSQLD